MKNLNNSIEELEMKVQNLEDETFETQSTLEEIAKQINKSPRTVKTRMMEMQEKGLIERINGKRNGERVVKQ